MNKILSAIALVSIVTIGTSLAQTHDTHPAARAASASSSAKGSALQPKLEALERKIWEGFKAQDFKAMKEVVADDALSADINGFATADQIEPMIKDYAVESYALQDWKLVRLGKGAAVLTYTVTNLSAKYKGQPAPSGPYYASTVYLNRGGKWVALYHQETLAASAMPGSTSATSDK